MEFKDKLKAMRASTGLSQEKFGRLWLISAINIANWEQGITKPPEYVQVMLDKLMKLDPDVPRKEQ